VRSVDLAIYADAVAGEAASLAARLERARSRMRQAEIERAARDELPPATVARLEALGFLATRPDRAEMHDLADAVAAVQELQEWIEARLAEVAD
jgi:hypothetical protein